MELLLEFAVTNLLQDIRIPCLINLECFPAMWTLDFIHYDFFSSLWGTDWSEIGPSL